MEIVKHVGHAITFEQYDGKFHVVINGIVKKFASLQSAKNAIDKEAVNEFKPQDVLIVDEQGYSPTTWKVKKVTVVKYTEEKAHRRGYLLRFFITSDGKKLRIPYDTLYPLTAQKKLEEICAALTLQSKAEHEAEEHQHKLRGKLNEIEGVTLDPFTGK